MMYICSVQILTALGEPLEIHHKIFRASSYGRKGGQIRKWLYIGVCGWCCKVPVLYNSVICFSNNALRVRVFAILLENISRLLNNVLYQANNTPIHPEHVAAKYTDDTVDLRA